MPSLFRRFAWVPLLAAWALPLAAADAPPAASDSDPAELKRQLATTQDELNTALHSFSLLQDENRQLKADAEKSADQLSEDQRAIAALKAEEPLAAQAQVLRTQVHQLQDQCAALAQEVLRLKTRLALAAPPASGSAPARPHP